MFQNNQNQVFGQIRILVCFGKVYYRLAPVCSTDFKLCLQAGISKNPFAILYAKILGYFAFSTFLQYTIDRKY